MQNLLIRPAHPIVAHAGMTAAKRLSELSGFLAFALILLLVIFPHYHITIGALHFGRFFIFLIIAIVLTFMMGLLVGFSAFWITNYHSLTYGLNPLTSILAGLMIPLSLFPQKVQQVFNLLPFKYMISVPVSALQGRIVGKEMWVDFGIGVLWVAIFAVLVNIVWNKGIRRFDAVGN